MKDYELQVLEQYEIEINSTRKVRGAVFCETECGPMLLKEVKGSAKQVEKVHHLCTYLEWQGYASVDTSLANREGNYVSQLEDGSSYVLKRWFTGSECDVRRERDVIAATKNLARLHRMLRKVDLDTEEPIAFSEGEDLRRNLMRHNRELKKVRSFVRKKVKKGDFEMLYLQHFEEMYDWAEQVRERLCHSGYDRLWEECRVSKAMIHGDYNYHNVLFGTEGIATTNFEHVQVNVQLWDLYYFLRKVLEKNQWSENLGKRMLDAYSGTIPLGKDELEYLAICIAYPEKFWKVADSYYRSNKVWLPVKSLEKLEASICQHEAKKQFLNAIFSFHL